MPLPYNLYIRYLVTCGYDDVTTLNGELKKRGLRPVGQRDLDDQWELIQSTLPKRLVESLGKDKTSSEFLRYMKILEVDELWKAHPTLKDSAMQSSVKLVYSILLDTAMRVTINALLIKGLQIPEITRMVSTKFSTQITERQLGIYERYFCNARLMTRSAWKEYIKECGQSEKRVYFIALTESSEVLKTELDLPSLANVGDGLQWLFTKSLLKAKSYMDVGTPEADRAAVMWADQVVKLADKYEKYRSGDQNDFAKTLQMEFDFVDEPFETPDDTTYKEVSRKQDPEKT